MRLPYYTGTHLWYLEALIGWRIAVQLLRPLRPIIGISCAIAISAAVDKLVDTLGVTTFHYLVDPYSYKKALCFFWAFAIGFYTPTSWLHELRRPAVRLTSFGIFVLLITLSGMPSFQEWTDRNIASLDEVDVQLPALVAAYSPWYLFVPRLYSMAYLTVTTFALTGWLPHTPQWYTAFGMMSLYSYLLHFDLLIVVAPHWNLFDVFPDYNVRTVLVLLLLPPLLMVALGGTLSRVLLWPIVEPNWARIFFLGRLEKVHAQFRAHGALAACQLAIDEMSPPLLKLKLPLFLTWFATTSAFYATLRGVFDLNTFLYCSNEHCDNDLRMGNGSAYAVVGPDADGHLGARVPGGRAFAILISAMLLIALLVEVGLVLRHANAK